MGGKKEEKEVNKLVFVSYFADAVSPSIRYLRYLHKLKFKTKT